MDDPSLLGIDDNVIAERPRHLERKLIESVNVEELLEAPHGQRPQPVQHEHHDAQEIKTVPCRARNNVVVLPKTNKDRIELGVVVAQCPESVSYTHLTLPTKA